MVFADDFTWFSFPNPYEKLYEIWGFRARAPFWTKIPAGCSRIPRKRQQNKAFWAPHFPLFQESMWKTYIIVYVFGTSGAHFREYRVTRRKPLIPIEQESSALGAFREFFRAPKTYKKRLRLCRVFERCFQESRFRENLLNPPSPVRPLLEVFCVFQDFQDSSVTERAFQRWESSEPPPCADGSASDAGGWGWTYPVGTGLRPPTLTLRQPCSSLTPALGLDMVVLGGTMVKTPPSSARA